MAGQIPALLGPAEQHAAPASVEAFAVAMDELVTWAERFGVIPMEQAPEKRRAQVAGIVQSYRSALSDLPADLLEHAIRRTIGAHKFRNLPLPGDIRAVVEAEFRDRWAILRRLRTAAIKAKYQGEQEDGPRERTPEQIAEAERMAFEAKRALVEAEPMRMPAEPDDLKPENSDHAAAMRRVWEETRSFRRIPKPWDKPAQHQEAAE